MYLFMYFCRLLHDLNIPRVQDRVLIVWVIFYGGKEMGKFYNFL